MTRPSYQLMTGEDGKLVSMFPSFSLHLHIAVILLLAVSRPLHGHQSLHPLGISQLTYSGCTCAKRRDEQCSLYLWVWGTESLFLLLLVSECQSCLHWHSLARKASAANATASLKTFEMSSFKLRNLTENVGKARNRRCRNISSWTQTAELILIFPGVKIKTCLQRQGDTVRGQLQATLLITKHHLIWGNREMAISLQHDIFILPDIVLSLLNATQRHGWMHVRRRWIDMEGGGEWGSNEVFWKTVLYSAWDILIKAWCELWIIVDTLKPNRIKIVFTFCVQTVFDLMCISVKWLGNFLCIVAVHCLWSSWNYLCSEPCLNLSCAHWLTRCQSSVLVMSTVTYQVPGKMGGKQTRETGNEWENLIHGC